MSRKVVNLGADVGESFGRWTLGNDAELLPLLSSANVACGFHAGDPQVIQATVARAAGLGVVLGAQVSYPDLAGFGRRSLAVSPDELVADTLYQLGALDGFARTEGVRVQFLRPHGALYHDASANPAIAVALLAAVARWPEPLAIVSQLGELHVQAQAAGLVVHTEGFVDRAYDASGRLLPRSQPGAVLGDPDVAAAQALRLAASGHTTLCVHGDNPAAVRVAEAVRSALGTAGYTVAW